MSNPIELIAQCNDYEELCFKLIKSAQGAPRSPLPPPRLPPVRPGGKPIPIQPLSPRAVTTPPPVPHVGPTPPPAPHSGPHPSGGRATMPLPSPHPTTSPGATPSPIAPAASGKPKFIIERWTGRGNPPRQSISPDNKVKIYVDRKGKPILEALPEEFFKKNDPSGVLRSGFGKRFRQAAKAHKKTQFLNKWEMATLGGKAKLIGKLAKKNKIMFATGGIGAIVSLGTLYSLFTGEKSESATEVGPYLAEEAESAAAKIDPSNVVKPSNELKVQLSEVITLSKEYENQVSKPRNKQILSQLSSDLSDINSALSFSKLKIDNQSSLQEFAGKVKNIKEKIKNVLDSGVLSKFAELASNTFGDNEGSELISDCEQNLTVYLNMIEESSQAAQRNVG